MLQSATGYMSVKTDLDPYKPNMVEGLKDLPEKFLEHCFDDVEVLIKIFRKK